MQEPAEILAPPGLAGEGIQGSDRNLCPRDELSLASGADDDGRAMSPLVVQGPPDCLAGMLVESHEERRRFVPEEHDQTVALD